VEENEQLRRTLYTVQVELEGLLKKHSNLKNSANVRLLHPGQDNSYLPLYYIQPRATVIRFANRNLHFLCPLVRMHMDYHTR
jgi:hypothetical protein